MCGIVGTVVLDGSRFEITDSYLTAMRDTMAHRGPDGAGCWISSDRRVGLGHRRLAIIDLSPAAAQPMSNEDGRLQVVFNGEIYNHADIRAELQRLGSHRWKTDHSDTEVILHAFEQWGIDCLSRFRGMFAIAMWDASAGELWLVRDRIGIKPLYYSIHDGRIVFASEIKAVLADPQQKRAVNEEGLYHYLSFLTVPAPQTLFEGIRKVPPGTWLRISQDGSVKEHRYWELWDHVVPLEGASEEEIASRLLDELRTSVRLRKIADVPVGVFLSGGIDSSTNAALFAEGASEPIRTFTIGYKGDFRSYRNEFHYARLMASRVGADHHELLLEAKDLLDFLPRMIHLQDEPIGDPVCVPVYYVSKLARDNGVIVCQVGEGADELFWGYPTWKLKLRLQQFNDLLVPGAVRKLGLAAMRLAGRTTGPRYEALRRASIGQPIFWGGADAFTETQKQRLLSPRLRNKLRGLSSWSALEGVHRRFRERSWEKSPLNWMAYLDLSVRLPELLLMRVDKMTMGVSLEGRVPFLDHKFVELAMGIPQAVKTRGGMLKHILKKAVRGMIPDELIDRPKQGFGVPVHEWFFQELGRRAEAELEDFCRRTDYFDRQEVRALLGSGQGPQAWYLLNFALWWKQYVG